MNRLEPDTHLRRFEDYHVFLGKRFFWRRYIASRNGNARHTEPSVQSDIHFSKFLRYVEGSNYARVRFRRSCNSVLSSCSICRYSADTLTKRLFSSSKTESNCCKRCSRTSIPFLCLHRLDLSTYGLFERHWWRHNGPRVFIPSCSFQWPNVGEHVQAVKQNERNHVRGSTSATSEIIVFAFPIRGGKISTDIRRRSVVKWPTWSFRSSRWKM